MSESVESWQEIAARKRADAFQKIPTEWRLSPQYLQQDQEKNHGVLHIPTECGILSEAEIAITENFDAVALLEQLATGKLRSVAVTTAFCKRAAISQQIVSSQVLWIK
jgi:amidase